MALTVSYESVSADLSRQDSGTTAVDCLIREGSIFAANAGDARALLVSENTFIQLTTDHRVDDQQERERVTKMGAAIEYPYVVRQGQGLMPTRSLGDQFFKPVGIIATPSINEHLLGSKDNTLILACDGLWDFMRNAEVAAFARKYPEPAVLLDQLTREVLIQRSGSDNLTMIAIAFKGS